MAVHMLAALRDLRKHADVKWVAMSTMRNIGFLTRNMESIWPLWLKGNPSVPTVSSNNLVAATRVWHGTHVLVIYLIVSLTSLDTLPPGDPLSRPSVDRMDGCTNDQCIVGSASSVCKAYGIS